MTEAEPKGGRAEARRLHILDAAQALFLQQGLSGTTMEAIARTAGVAKPTLYAYFSDKEAVFRAVIERVLAGFRAAVEKRLEDEGTAEDRVAQALAAKFLAVHELLAGSPHAQELMTDNVRHAGAEFAALDVWLEDRIRGVLMESGPRHTAERAPLLIACADGIFHRARSADEIAAGIPFVVERILRP